MRILVQILIIAILGVAGIYGWQNRADLPLVGQYFGEPQQQQRRGGGRAVAVDVATVEPGVLVDSVRVVGTARANQSVTVTSEIAARIAELRIQEGAQVERGDVLVRFANAEIAADLAGARSAQKLAEQVYDRGVATRKKGLITEARTEELAQAVRTADAEVSQLQARIGKFTLRAPFAGRLGLMAPEESVLVVDGGAFVFAVRDGKAVRQPVKLGRRRPGTVEILEGLSPGDVVVTGGVQKVRPGADVAIRNAPKAES